ncbi:histone deacetylase 1 [Moniliophthora roreri MCA 2997]|uniref:histone deacetylase n=1 Tax=Moniliophthora roreri (strain MCA 2997) TaxID=1381753 RepID=V2Y772_MONRO|nr:histone deacetylase 1 [Moniliophthora roreri MCA 2997]
MFRRRVSYYYDSDVGSYTYGFGHTMKPHRIKMAHDLIAAYDMLPKMHVIRPSRSTPERMTSFHTDEYIQFLERVTPETAEELTYRGTRFLVGEDNPPFEGLFEFCSISAGGSIAAAQRIASGSTDIAINWAGGLHHAKKSEAAGFCYVNDIVLCILELLRTFPRVLYVDIDCHHGDGVEEAFYTTDRVMTASLHRFGDFFPGSGSLDDKGTGKGKGYAVNVPFRDGITDESFMGVFNPVMEKILEVFRPSAVVLQCGADSLAGDKLGGLNLSMQGHARCVQYFRDKALPLILLGGGGYTVKNVAKAWTYETACALGIEDTIDHNLPYHEYLEWFGPRYRLEVLRNNMDDMNTKDGYLDHIRTQVLKQLIELPCAPSVGLHDVPSESIGTHTGLYIPDDEYEPQDELDQKLAQHMRYVYRLQDQASSSDTSSDLTSLDSGDSESDDGLDPHSLDLHSRASSVAEKREKPRGIMSILTNEYTHLYLPPNGPSHKGVYLPTSKTAKRKFFGGSCRSWRDDEMEEGEMDL